jgi:hypothetical protein
MDTESIWLTTRSAIAVFALGTMIAFMLQRNVKQYKEANRWNWARFLMILSFAFSLFSHVVLFGFYGLDLQGFESLIGTSISKATLNTTFIATTLMFSSMFAFYINQWDRLLLFPLFVQVGAIFMTFTLKEINFEFYYIMIFGVISIIFLFEAGIRLKDNMALGIGIMGLFQMIASFGNFWFESILSLVSVAFGAITITGLFRVFGKQEA